MANISTMGRTKYALTATDILNGFAAVPVLWDSPFNDTNYNLSWSVHDLGFPAPSLNYGVGDFHFKTGAGFTAVVAILAAIPLVQGQVDYPLLTTAQTFSYTVTVSGLYAVTATAWTLDSTASTSADLVFEWVGPGGALNANTSAWLTGPATATPFSGSDTFTFATAAVAGSAIVIGTANLNKTFPYGMSIRVVKMPDNTVLPIPGDAVEVEAMASHK